MRLFIVFILLLTTSLALAQVHADSWKKVSKNKKGTIFIYWEESRPFIYKNENQKLTGVEYEIMEGIKKYLHETHGIDLRIEWVEGKSFANTYALIRNTQRSGIFATSAFSITPEREQYVSFSPPYMADISVLITSLNIPIVKNIREFEQVFSSVTAVTIKETTYEKELLKIKSERNLPFTLTYIPSSSNILRTIEEMDNAFGYIDLPVYMMMFNNNPSIKVKRQNLMSVKRKGYGIIYPKTSDWSAVIDDYFTNETFKPEFEKIIARYIDIDLYHFIESIAISSNNQVSLLTKEKEIQNKNIAEKSQQIARDERTRNILIFLLTLIFISFVAIALLYRKKNQQKEEIELQRIDIEQKSDQLEKRNRHLTALDEEKNNLIRILAHDLRTPINHIQGLAQVLLLDTQSLGEEKKKMVRQITDSSIRINRMITGILDIDAIENERTRIFIESVSLYPLIQQLTKDFKVLAERKSIELHFHQSEKLHAVKGDSLFLMQVFENLISNAIKFSPREKYVTITLNENNDRIRVGIKDEGPGFAEEDKSKLFKKFQRLSARPTNGEDSTGLGLSIVKKYVELMNGKVWCDSEPGNGSTFWIELEKA